MGRVRPSQQIPPGHTPAPTGSQPNNRPNHNAGPNPQSGSQPLRDASGPRSEQVDDNLRKLRLGFNQSHPGQPLPPDNVLLGWRRQGGKSSEFPLSNYNTWLRAYPGEDISIFCFRNANGMDATPPNPADISHWVRMGNAEARYPLGAIEWREANPLSNIAEFLQPPIRQVFIDDDFVFIGNLRVFRGMPPQESLPELQGLAWVTRGELDAWHASTAQIDFADGSLNLKGRLPAPLSTNEVELLRRDFRSLFGTKPPPCR